MLTNPISWRGRTNVSVTFVAGIAPLSYLTYYSFCPPLFILLAFDFSFSKLSFSPISEKSWVNRNFVFLPFLCRFQLSNLSCFCFLVYPLCNGSLVVIVFQVLFYFWFLTMNSQEFKNYHLEFMHNEYTYEIKVK